VLDLAVDKGIIDKSGAWFSYNKERIGQGRENSRQFLKDNPAMLADIEEKLMQIIKPAPKEEKTK
jgi:recombination protein RecA